MCSPISFVRRNPTKFYLLFTRDIAEYLTNVLQEVLEPLITGKDFTEKKN